MKLLWASLYDVSRPPFRGLDLGSKSLFFKYWLKTSLILEKNFLPAITWKKGCLRLIVNELSMKMNYCGLPSIIFRAHRFEVWISGQNREEDSLPATTRKKGCLRLIDNELNMKIQLLWASLYDFSRPPLRGLDVGSKSWF